MQPCTRVSGFWVMRDWKRRAGPVRQKRLATDFVPSLSFAREISFAVNIWRLDL